jgi:hypothetical protein
MSNGPDEADFNGCAKLGAAGIEKHKKHGFQEDAAWQQVSRGAGRCGRFVLEQATGGQAMRDDTHCDLIKTEDAPGLSP